MQDFLARVSGLELVVLVRFIIIAALKRGVMLSRSVATVAAESIMECLTFGHSVSSLLAALVKNRVEEYGIDLDFMDPYGSMEKAIRLELTSEGKLHLLDGKSKEEVDAMVKAMMVDRLRKKFGLDPEAECFSVHVHGELRFFVKMDRETFDEFMIALVVTEFLDAAYSTISAVDFDADLTPRLVGEETEEDDSEEDEEDEALALDFHGKYSELFHERMEYWQNSKAYPLGCARVNPHFGDEAMDREDEMVCLPSHLNKTLLEKTKPVLIALTKEAALARKGFSSAAQAHLKGKGRKGRKFVIPSISVLEYQAAYLYVVTSFDRRMKQDPEMSLKSVQVLVNGSYKTATISGDRLRSIHDADGEVVASWKSPKMKYYFCVKSSLEDFFKSTDCEFTGPILLSKNGKFLLGKKTEVNELGYVWPALLISASLVGFIIPLGENEEAYLARKARKSQACKKAGLYLSKQEFFRELDAEAPQKSPISWMFGEVTTHMAFVAIQGDMERRLLELFGCKIVWNKPTVEIEGEDGKKLGWTKPNSYQVLGLNGQLRSNIVETTGSSEIVEDDDGSEWAELEQAV